MINMYYKHINDKPPNSCHSQGVPWLKSEYPNTLPINPQDSPQNSRPYTLPSPTLTQALSPIPDSHPNPSPQTLASILTFKEEDLPVSDDRCRIKDSIAGVWNVMVDVRHRRRCCCSWTCCRWFGEDVVVFVVFVAWVIGRVWLGSSIHDDVYCLVLTDDVYGECGCGEKMLP